MAASMAWGRITVNDVMIDDYDDRRSESKVKFKIENTAKDGGRANTKTKEDRRSFNVKVKRAGYRCVYTLLFFGFSFSLRRFSRVRRRWSSSSRHRVS
jgi:hypothetical protein